MLPRKHRRVLQGHEAAEHRREMCRCLMVFSGPQDGVHLPPAGGAGEGVSRGPLPRRLRPRDARHEDGAARGQNTGEQGPTRLLRPPGKVFVKESRVYGAGFK